MAGAYLHIPFCKQACTYCNFHFSTSLRRKDDVVAAIIKEISNAGDFIPTSEEIETIYFGGGTPSILDVRDLEKLLKKLRQKFNVLQSAEITLEANPDDVNSVLLKQWRELGINRLSLGVQSFNEDELRWMNRAHTATQSHDAINEIKKAGFVNYSIDIIFGSPFLSYEQLLRTIELIGSLNVPHVSGYALTVEPGTTLNKMIRAKKTPALISDRQALHLSLFARSLEKYNYEQYEISNFAQPGFRSKHNSSYWQAKPYYGFGPSAHSYNGSNRRRWNISNNQLYINLINSGLQAFEEEMLTKQQQLNEYYMLALRTSDGVSNNYLNTHFPDRNLKILTDTAQSYINKKMLVATPDGITLTQEGRLFADGIAAAFFG